MEVIKIEGGHKLSGSVEISGSKNAIVALIPATILGSKPVTLYGVPDISDVNALSDILKELNVEVKRDKGQILIDPSNIKNVPLIQDVVTKLRASYYFMGAMLGRYGEVEIKMPGGCYLGPRPIDLHLKGFEALGAKIDYVQGSYVLKAEQLIGTKIYLDIASVGATLNIMLAAVFAKGRTVIENAAKEPEIIDVATMLNKMGAEIRGAGTSIIMIDGVESLGGCVHDIIPDRIEAATYLSIAAANANEVTITNVIPSHLESLLAKLTEIGIDLEVGVDKIIVRRDFNKKLNPVEITTQPYPGFATDIQQPITALLTQVDGLSTVTETIYTERFKHCAELNKLGAKTKMHIPSASIQGPTPLQGNVVTATDLRCGACLVVAGLLANGVTEIRDIYHIDRGYDHLIEKLTNLGAKIWREEI